MAQLDTEQQPETLPAATSPPADSQPRPLPAPPAGSELTAASTSEARTPPDPHAAVAPPSNVPTAPPPTDATVEASLAAVWPLKLIHWPPGQETRALIVMQARNGPCSLIALCNVLILRGDITIYPRDRRSVSYEYLASLLADFLVSRMNDDSAFEGLSAALSKLPDLQEGMDINSVWSSHSSFKQLGEGGELKLFHLCGVPLVHGWLADPSSPEYDALLRVEDYDGAVNLIVSADHLTKGQLVESDQSVNHSVEAGEVPGAVPLTNEQQQMVKDAWIIRQFLEENSSQLTYRGLFHLTSALQPGLYAFFRNSHLSVLYKTESSEQPLYTLVTDSVFTREQAIVWETLEDVDGSAATFVDAHLTRSSTAGGDYSGRSAEAALRDSEVAMSNLDLNDPDVALAQQLQDEEDRIAREARRRARAEQERKQASAQAGGSPPLPTPQDEDYRRRVQSNLTKKKKDDCVIM